MSSAPSLPLKALIVEDCPNDVTILLHTLRQAGYVVQSRCVQSAEELRSALSSQNWDIVFSDYAMPDFNGFEALAIVQEMRPGFPSS